MQSAFVTVCSKGSLKSLPSVVQASSNVQPAFMTVYNKAHVTSLPGVLQASSIVQPASVTLPHGLPAHLLLHAQC